MSLQCQYIISQIQYCVYYKVKVLKNGAPKKTGHPCMHFILVKFSTVYTCAWETIIAPFYIEIGHPRMGFILIKFGTFCTCTWERTTAPFYTIHYPWKPILLRIVTLHSIVTYWDRFAAHFACLQSVTLFGARYLNPEIQHLK